jgi:hypothetical protein
MDVGAGCQEPGNPSFSGWLRPSGFWHNPAIPRSIEARFGTELIESLAFDPDRTLFVSIELPRKLVAPRLRSRPGHVEFVRSMERIVLEEAAEISRVTEEGSRTPSKR